MSHSAEDFGADWEEALESLGAEPGDAALLSDVEGATFAVIRRRLMVRRVGLVVAGALLFAGGFLTGGLRVPSGAPTPPGPEPRTFSPVQLAGPVELEQRADEAAPEERARLLLAAGDRYLEEGTDVEASLRCYRRLLADDEALAAPESEESQSWLWLAMKHMGSD